MNKIIIALFVIFLSACSLNKVILHHGVHNLEKKQTKLKINYSNKNDIIKLIGPPSTKSSFDNDVFIYIERKTSSAKITHLGKKKLLVNNVLVLEINSSGVLTAKKFYNKEDMKQIDFDKDVTKVNYSKKSFIYSFLSSVRTQEGPSYHPSCRRLSSYPLHPS